MRAFAASNGRQVESHREIHRGEEAAARPLATRAAPLKYDPLSVPHHFGSVMCDLRVRINNNGTGINLIYE